MNLDRCLFSLLVWKLLEYKAAYYCLELIHDDWKIKLNISDAEYDKLKSQYLILADELGLSPTLNSIRGFDIHHPMCRIILMKLRTSYTSTQKLVTGRV